MTVELSNEQYGTIARLLVAMAAGKRFQPDGRQKNIPRSELVNLAREACQAIRLHYLGEGGGNSSFPEEIGLQYRQRKNAAINQQQGGAK